MSDLEIKPYEFLHRNLPSQVSSTTETDLSWQAPKHFSLPSEGSTWEHSAPKMHSEACDKQAWKAHPCICVYTQLYLESQDNGPNKAKCQPVIPIHNIMRSHVF